MFTRVLLVLLLVATPLAAQRGGGGGGGRGGGGFGGPTVSNPFEEFVNKLRLDRKTQVPRIQELFKVAEVEAGLSALEMVQLRQQMLNNDPSKVSATNAAFTAAAGKMVAIEVKLFTEIDALLKPNQQKDAPKAFEMLAGYFRLSPAPPGSMPGGGRGGQDFGGPSGGDVLNRLDVIASSLGLTNDQKKDAKTILDESHKSAAPIRARLTSARLAMAAAIQAGQGQTEIDSSIKGYAADVTSMANVEMDALRKVLNLLTDVQKTTVQANGIRTPFFLVRGMFLDDKKWNVAPVAGGY